MLKQLYQYIGQSIVYDGMRCQLIEILEDGPSLVFSCPGQKSSIQTNQHGEASRRTPDSYTVPLLSSIHRELHPAARALIPDDQQQAFIDYFSAAEVALD